MQGHLQAHTDPQAGGRGHMGNGGSLETSNPALIDTPPCNKATPSNPSRTVPLTGVQAFTHWNLCGPLLNYHPRQILYSWATLLAPYLHCLLKVIFILKVLVILRQCLSTFSGLASNSPCNLGFKPAVFLLYLPRSSDHTSVTVPSSSPFQIHSHT